MVFLALLLDRQAPAGILRAEAGEHRLAGMHGHVERPGDDGSVVRASRARGRRGRSRAMRRPASRPPTARTPQSMRVSPSGPCETSTRRACGIADDALNDPLHLFVDARPVGLCPGLHRLLVHHVHSVPPSWPAQAAKIGRNSFTHQLRCLDFSPGSRRHSAYRAVSVDAIPAVRPICGPFRPDHRL